jgi:hypothetical protein
MWQKEDSMTVDDLMAMLKKYSPHMKVFAYNIGGQMQEVRSVDILSGEDEAWHEKQSEDVLLIS